MIDILKCSFANVAVVLIGLNIRLRCLNILRCMSPHLYQYYCQIKEACNPMIHTKTLSKTLMVIRVVS